MRINALAMIVTLTASAAKLAFPLENGLLWARQAGRLNTGIFRAHP
jgi:hypothetical protein